MDERNTTLPSDYSSFVLEGLLTGLRPPPKKVVLDLGPANGGNLDQLAGFTGHHCKLFIANFFERLSEAGPSARRNIPTFTATCSRLLDFPAATRFDLILAWDVFNYLSLLEIEALVGHLSRHSHGGAHLMALVSIYKMIPDRPFRFCIRSADTLRYETLSRGLRDSPRYTENQLVKRMSGFQVDKAMLLRNGMQEYSFVLGTESEGPPGGSGGG